MCVHSVLAGSGAPRPRPCAGLASPSASKPLSRGLQIKSNLTNQLQMESDNSAAPKGNSCTLGARCCPPGNVAPGPGLAPPACRSPLPVPGWTDSTRTHFSGGRQQLPTHALRLPETPPHAHRGRSVLAPVSSASHIALRDASHAFLCENTSQMGKPCPHLKMFVRLAWPEQAEGHRPGGHRCSVSLLPPAGLHVPHSALCHLLPSRDSQSCPRPPPEGRPPCPREWPLSQRQARPAPNPRSSPGSLPCLC